MGVVKMPITLLAVGHDQKILIWNDILGAHVNLLYKTCTLIEYLHMRCSNIIVSM